jgi:hypothetical protein
MCSSVLSGQDTLLLLSSCALSVRMMAELGAFVPLLLRLTLVRPLLLLLSLSLLLLPPRRLQRA